MCLVDYFCVYKYYKIVSRKTFMYESGLDEETLGYLTIYIKAHTNHNKKSIRSTHVSGVYTRDLFKVIISFTGFLYKQYYNNVFYIYTLYRQYINV